MKKELSVMTKKFLWSILIVLIISSYAIQIVSNVFASVAGSFDGTNAYDINNNRVNMSGPSNPQKVIDLSAKDSDGNANPAGKPVKVDGIAYNRFGVYSNGDKIIQSDNKYSYSFIPNKNTTVKFWNESNVNDQDILVSSTNRAINVVPSNDNQSGKIGCYIKNLGLYVDENSEIHEISLKCTFSWEPYSYIYSSPAGTIKQYPLIRVIANHETKRMTFSFYNQSYKVKFDIYDSDPEAGGEKTNINFSTYVSDIDGYQFVGLGNFNEEADGGLKDHINEIQSMAGGYIYTDTTPNTTYKNYVWFYSKGGNRYELLQDTIRVELANVNSFEMVCGCPNDYASYNYGDKMFKSDTISPTRDEIIQRIIDKKQNAGITFSGESYVRYNIENPVEKIDDVNQKNVESNQVGIDEEFYYKIYHRVPDENSAFYYNNYTIESILPEGVEYLEANVYKAYGNEDNENIINSEDFEINYDETTRKVTATAKNVKTAAFYNEIYMLKIKLKLQKNNIQDVTENSAKTVKTFALNNHSTVIVNRNNDQTNMNIIDNGTYTIHPIDKNNDNKLIIRPDFAVQLNTGAIELAPYNNTYSSQKFIIKYEEKGYYSFRKGNSALTSDTNNEGKLRTASYTLNEDEHIVNDKQLWRIMKSGDFYMISPKVFNGSSSVEKMALTANKGIGDYTDGGLLDVEYIPEDYNLYQLFSLEKVDTSAIPATDIVLETNEVNTTYLEKKISVKKQWTDNSNVLNSRPASISFTVFNGETPVYNGTMTTTTNTKTVKTGYLPVFNSNEEVINYTVAESDVTGYTPKYTVTKNENGVSLLKIDNTIDKYPYRIEYYYENNNGGYDLDTSKTEHGTAEYMQKIEEYTNKTKTGYKSTPERVDPNNGLTITGSTEDENVMKIYYNRKNYAYRIEHYYDGVIDDSLTVKDVTAPYRSKITSADYELHEKTGYRYVSSTPETLTIGTNANNNVIKVYYQSVPARYKIEYYYGGTKDDDATQTVDSTFNSIITEDDCPQKPKDGYEFDSCDGPLTVGLNEDENIIRMYYVPSGETKTLRYYVRYYKDNSLQKADNQTVTKTVQVLEPNTLPVKKDEINTRDKYEGYTCVRTNPTPIPDEVINNTYIYVYYEKNKYPYTIEYYYDNVKDDSKTKEMPAVDYQTKIEEYPEEPKEGYVFDHTDNLPLTIGTNNTENVIKVYYVRRSDLSATVHHYIEGTTTEVAPTETLNNLVLNQVIEGESKKKTDIEGYEYVSSDPQSITIGNDSTQNVLNLYYSKKQYEYRVEHYYDNVIDENQTVRLQAPFESVINREDYERKEKDGYTFSDDDGVPLTIGTNTDENVIKVYYTKRKDLKATVNYYKLGTTQKLATSKSLKNQTFGATVKATSHKKTISGYKYVSANPETIVIGTNSAQNVLNLYYDIDETQRKDLQYTVEYYKDGEIVNEDTQIETLNVQVLDPDTMKVSEEKINITNKYPGYKFDHTDPEEIPNIVVTGSVIKVYYVKDEFDYRVEYYYDNVKDDEATETNKAEYQSVIDQYTDKVKPGYKFEKVENKPLTIGTNKDENVIKVYYKKDNDQRKDLQYTVEYYKDGEIVNEDTQTETTSVQVLEPDTMSVDKTKINTENKYEGYVFDHTNPETIPNTVNNGDVIKVYYKKDKFDYTIEYYYENVKDDKATEGGKAEYQSVIDKYTDKVKTGYIFDKVENKPLTIGTDSTKNVMKVYYVIDNNQKKNITYTVEYYKDGEIIDEDTQLESTTVQILDPDTIPVNKEKINTENKYEGYVFKNTDPGTIPDTANNGDVIKVYYEKRKDLTGTVNYYIKGTTQKLADSKQLSNLTFGDNITALSQKIDIYGYKFVSANPEQITVSTKENENVLNLYYELIQCKLNITKIDKSSNKKLPGVVYEIRKINDNGKEDTSFNSKQETTNANGLATFSNLTYGKYRVTEIKAAEGHNLSANPVDIEVNDKTVDENNEINIVWKNNNKLVLPSTGGHGILYTILFGIAIIFISIMIKTKKIYIAKKQ